MIKSRYVHNCHYCGALIAKQIKKGYWLVIKTNKKRRSGLNIYCNDICKAKYYNMILRKSDDAILKKMIKEYSHLSN